MPPHPTEPVIEDRNTRTRSVFRSGWMLAGGAALLLISLFVWLDSIQTGLPPMRGDGGTRLQPDPDGDPEPGPALATPFPGERCIPWHVSAVETPPADGTRLLVVSSRLADPYGLVLSGLASECGSQPTRIAEEIEPAALEQALRAERPQAVVAIGAAALDRLQAVAPDTPLLYTLVPDPHARGLVGDALVGVSPWIPPAQAARHLVHVLPASRRRLALIFPPGLAEAARQGLVAVRATGREAEALELVDRAALEPLLERAAGFDAWWVLPAADGLDAATFNRIQIAAENRAIPLLVSDEEHVRSGAYAGIGPDSYRLGRQLCRLAGALQHDRLPAGERIFCPEYSFAALHNAVLEKLGYILDPAQLSQVKLYKWH